MSASSSAADRLAMMHPRLIAKRPLLLLLFAVVAAMLAALTEPKLFEMLLRGAIPLPLHIVVLGTVVTESILLALIWVTLESRYVVAAQTRVASIAFLAIVVGASLLGFWFRMSRVGDSAGQKRSFGPNAYTFRETAVAVMALSVVGTIFTTAHNLVFLRKADYAQFNYSRGELLDHVRDMEKRFLGNEAVTATDGAKLERLASNALGALPTPLAAEVGAYRDFIDRSVRAPLTTIATLCASPDVRAAPELFLRACGLATPPDPWDPADVAEMSAAYRKVVMTR